MLLRIFKGTGPGVILLIVITFFAIWINALTKPGIIQTPLYDISPMPLYAILKNLAGSHHIGVILSFLMVVVLSFLLVNFNTTGLLITERTFLPALFFILIGGLFPDYQVLNPVLPAAIFLILAIIRIMDGYHIQGTAYSYFDAGILISTGSLFYGDLLWFGLLLIIGIALLRTGNLKEIVISILGLITPYLITFGVYYVIGRDTNNLVSLIHTNLFSRTEAHHFSRLSVVTMLFMVVLILVSLMQLFKYMNTKKIKSRKAFSLLIWTLFISVTEYILLPSVSVEIIFLAGIPVSYLLSQYFVSVKKKLVPEILFTLLLIFILLLQVWHP